MRRTGVGWALCLACGLAPGQAVAAKEPASPRVDAEGRVTFRLEAPDAEKTLVVLEGAGPVAMEKSAAGTWTLTTEPLAPDLYLYFFVVDGLPLSDPANPSAKPRMTGGVESMVHVPGPGSLAWEIADVPRGTVRSHSYESVAIGERREYFVYTPPGYDPAGERRYPVLYLLHGVGDDATAWRVAGRADIILDNLIARGEVEPMLVVMPLGYGFAEPAERMWQVVNNMPEHLEAQDVLATALVEEIVPRVEADYRVAADRESRAVAGVSMGGSQALWVGLHNLDRFAWVGSFSGALMMFYEGYDETFAGIDGQINERLRLLWLACGEEDFVLPANHLYRDWLTQKGVRFIWAETPGGHTWRVWRRNLIDFAPLLFRPRE